MLKTAKKIGFFAFLLISLLLISRDVKADIDEGEVIHIGDNVTARLNKKGVLTISGKGDMWNDTDDTNVYYNKWFNNKRNRIYKVVIKRGVTTIGRRAFSYMENIQSVSIPDTVNYIDTYAFLKTTSLKSIKIPANVKKIGIQSFYESGIKRCSIGKGLGEIDDFAFSHCYRLKSISIPSGTRAIGMGAFAESGLKTVKIGDDVREIKKNAFPVVKATVYSQNIILGENAFEPLTIFYAYKGSSIDQYAAMNGHIINYLKDKNDKSKEPAKINGVRVSSLSKGFRVRFNRVNGARGYEIRYAANSALLDASKTITIANIYNVTGLEGGKAYYVKVRAYTIVKGKKIYGKYSKIVKCKTKK